MENAGSKFETFPNPAIYSQYHYGNDVIIPVNLFSDKLYLKKESGNLLLKVYTEGFRVQVLNRSNKL